MRNKRKYLPLVFLVILLSSCASKRKRTYDNNLKILGSKMSFDVEKLDRNKYIFWVNVKTKTGFSGHSGLGNFYADEGESLKINLDNKYYYFTRAKNDNLRANRGKYINVTEQQVVQIANGHFVEVNVTGRNGNMDYTGTFDQKNFIKFQKFVKKYIDPTQEIREAPSRSWLLWFLGFYQ